MLANASDLFMSGLDSLTEIHIPLLNQVFDLTLANNSLLELFDVPSLSVINGTVSLHGDRSSLAAVFSLIWQLHSLPMGR